MGVSVRADDIADFEEAVEVIEGVGKALDCDFAFEEALCILVSIISSEEDFIKVVSWYFANSSKH